MCQASSVPEPARGLLCPAHVSELRGADGSSSLSSTSLGSEPAVGLLGRTVVLFLVFKGSPTAFLAAAPVDIPNNARGFPFLRVLTNPRHFLVTPLQR